MKKFLLAILMVLIFSTSAAYASMPISLFVNGEILKSDPEPQILNNRTMVPLRLIAEALGADVSYDQIQHRIDIYTKPQANLVNMDGVKTTWPYWVENGDLYLEYRNAVELLRNKYKSPWYSITFYPHTDTLFINGVKYIIQTKQIDDYTLISCNNLVKQGIIKLTWDQENANLTIQE